MSTNYPGGTDDLDPVADYGGAAGDPLSEGHLEHHTDVGSAIEAIETYAAKQTALTAHTGDVAPHPGHTADADAHHVSFVQADADALYAALSGGNTIYDGQTFKPSAAVDDGIIIQPDSTGYSGDLLTVNGVGKGWSGRVLVWETQVGGSGGEINGTGELWLYKDFYPTDVYVQGSLYGTNDWATDGVIYAEGNKLVATQEYVDSEIAGLPGGHAQAHGNADHTSTFITAGDVHAQSHGNADHTSTFITATGVTYENLDANGDVGAAAGKLAIGDHVHAGFVSHGDQNQFIHYEDFMVEHSLITPSGWKGSTIANGAIVGPGTAEANHPGQIGFQVSATTNSTDQGIYSWDGQYNIFPGGGVLNMGVVGKWATIPVAGRNTRMTMGFNSIATQYIAWRGSLDNSSQWVFQVVSPGGTYTENTSSAIDTNWHTFEFVTSADWTEIDMYIDDVQVGNLTGMAAVDIALQGWLSMNKAQSYGGAGVRGSFVVDAVWMEYVFTTPR